MKKVYLIAVLFALIAGFATYMFAKQIDAKTTIKDVEMVEVVVAAQDIPENTQITEEMLNNEETPYFVTKNVVKENMAPDAVSDRNELLDCITVDPIYSGEQINKKRVESKDGEDVALSFKLSPDMVAYSFRAQEITGVDGYISEGDTVDVMVSEVVDDEFETRVEYESLKVIKVSTNTVNASSAANGSKITEYSTLTVEVSKEDALKLYEIEQNYDYKLILNPRG